MSVASGPTPTADSRDAREVGVTGTPQDEACPLCGAPLHPEQEWCLHCGAAARTRLAASSRWKASIIALAVVATLALGVLAAAVVKLAVDSSSTTNVTRHIIGGPASVTSPGTAVPPRATPPAPPAITAIVGLGPVTMLRSTTATLNGSVNPQGVPTTFQFRYRTTASPGWTPSNAPLRLGSGKAPIVVNAKLAYLTPGTTYVYKLIASKAGRAVSTHDATFTTPPASTSATAPPRKG